MNEKIYKSTAPTTKSFSLIGFPDFIVCICDPRGIRSLGYGVNPE